MAWRWVSNRRPGWAQNSSLSSVAKNDSAMAASTVVPSPTEESVDPADGGELLPESIAQLLPGQ